MIQNLSVTKKVLFACGGTGGHVFPAVGIAEELQKLGFEVAFTGRAGSLEERLIQGKFEFWPSPAYPLVRASLWQNFTLPWKFLNSLFQAKKVIEKYRADIVIGTGGYVSLPAVLVAGLQKKAVYLQEQNAVAGVANKVSARYAKAIFVSGSAAERAFDHHEVHPFGTPVRAVKIENLKKPSAFENYEKVVLILGGSQGARGINLKLKEQLELMAQNSKILWVWQAGKRECAIYKEYTQKYSNIQVTDFIDDVYSHMHFADVLVSRSGASTLAEILLLGKASVLVPYPYATANHQEANARAVEMCGGAVVELESEANQLVNKVLNLLENNELRTEMSSRAQNLGRPDAAQKIAEYIQQKEQN